MDPFHSGVAIWKPSEAWWRHHRQDRAYEVVIRVEPADALEAAWSALVLELTRTDAGVLLDGGASLCRCSSGLVEVVSGGEDAFDSLAWSVNVTLGEAVVAADPEAKMRVVAERQVADRR